MAWTATFVAAKLEEHQAKGWSIFNLLRVFHRINCRQMGQPLDLLQPHSLVRPAPCTATRWSSFCGFLVPPLWHRRR